MKPMVDAKDPASSWFASAAELSATAHYQLGQFDQAGALYGRIAKLPDVTRSLQSRSVQMAGMLGVDAVTDRAAENAAAEKKGNAAPKAAAAAKRSEEHTSELQSLMRISYAVFCLKKKHSIQQQPDTSKI